MKFLSSWLNSDLIILKIVLGMELYGPPLQRDGLIFSENNNDQAYKVFLLKEISFI